MTIRTFLQLGFVAFALLTACRSGEDQEIDSVSHQDVRETRETLDPGVVNALDEGNAAYRDEVYDTALRHYETAADLDDSVAAAWFGIYMANLALGNIEAADSAMARARTLTPDASLMDPDEPTP